TAARHPQSGRALGTLRAVLPDGQPPARQISQPRGQSSGTRAALEHAALPRVYRAAGWRDAVADPNNRGVSLDHRLLPPSAEAMRWRASFLCFLLLTAIGVARIVAT